MDLDIEVAKLRLLKADYQSRHYRLEDQLLKFFPQQVEQDTQVLTGLQKDQATAMENPVPEKHFVGMEIKGKAFADKEAAGEAILAACILAEWAWNACCGMACQPIGDSAGGSVGAGCIGKAGGLGDITRVSLRDNIKKVLSTHGAHFKCAKVLQVM